MIYNIDEQSEKKANELTEEMYKNGQGLQAIPAVNAELQDAGQILEQKRLQTITKLSEMQKDANERKE